MARVDDKSFSVSIIPHTLDQTILSLKKTGDIVNLENDCIGKYVEKLMRPEEPQPSQESIITETFLIEHGF